MPAAPSDPHIAQQMLVDAAEPAPDLRLFAGVPKRLPPSGQPGGDSLGEAGRLAPRECYV
jgi:hypothetical protein